MAMLDKHQFIRVLAMCMSVGLLSGLSSCGASKGDNQPDPSSNPAAQGGNVAIFTPSDGITVSQHTPLNKWAKLIPELTDALLKKGMPQANIISKTSDGLNRQSMDVQDYVVDTLTRSKKDASSGGRKKSSGTTLIVAPALATGQTTLQYGDYASRGESTVSRSSKNSNKSESSNGSADSKPDSSGGGDGTQSNGKDDTATNGGRDKNSGNDSQQTQRSEDSAAKRLISALRLARQAGAHVIVMSNLLTGFTPDVFVRMSTAEEIGSMQAEDLVSKLALDKASSKNPKSLELLLPRASDDNSEASSGDEFTKEFDDTFTSQAFAGVWKVLQPYFTDGRAYSPSSCMDAKTTKADWKSCAFTVGKNAEVEEELDKRLSMQSKTDAHTRIDGIIGMNDFVTSGVIDELSTLGYVGSSADVNPTITLPDVMGNIIGKRELQKKAVPKPDTAKQPSQGSQGTKGQSNQDGVNAGWPIVVGFGAYLDMVPQVVNGKQWMTALENRKALAKDTANAAVRLNKKQSLKSISSLRSQSIAGKRVPTIHTQLLAVSASNLKTSLIDPGYISLADAGL